ncbi:hypothetical protein [Maritimibacter sp. HL-12]|uniref:hypothetical protein n=1 Tax=Maritimibacter sp. HL-12 TaxID=1162418 RepID=UPI000A0F1D84|nr:hypothetical protein [Maritimibacter sp. HL-12]SMH51604.1 hypothetical protein SAMN05661107_2507 [Maritimibacter sp. HL-12]
MEIERNIAHAPRSRAVAGSIAGLRGGCVGCKECTGVCQALIEALTLPDTILKEKSA